MKLDKSILIHLAAFALIVFFFLSSILTQLVYAGPTVPFPKSWWLTPANWLKFAYIQKVNDQKVCEELRVLKPLNLSKTPVSIFDNPEVTLQVNCDHGCNFTFTDNLSDKTFEVPAPSANNPAGIPDLGWVVYDHRKKIVIYSTGEADPSTRLVADFNGKLLQVIDEAPGENRQLNFLNYLPESGYLAYYDPLNLNHWFYKVDGIDLIRANCNIN